MKSLSLLLLHAATPLVNSQQSTKPKPDDGSFVRNTYRNDFFGFSYTLPGEWFLQSYIVLETAFHLHLRGCFHKWNRGWEPT
jgi:hypothetical protein